MEHRLTLYLSGVALLILGSCLVYMAGSVQQALQQAHDKEKEMNATRKAVEETLNSGADGAKGGTERLTDAKDDEGLGDVSSGATGLTTDVEDEDSQGQQVVMSDEEALQSNETAGDVSVDEDGVAGGDVGWQKNVTYSDSVPPSWLWWLAA